MIDRTIRGLGSFLVNRLLSGIWVPALLAVSLGILLAAGLGLADLAGLSESIAALGGPFGSGAFTVNELFEAALAVQIAVLTLYFSITLLVLTLAAQSLGVRLIERWIARIEIRATLATWAGLVAYSLTGQLFVTIEGPQAFAPRATILADLLMTAMALGWLGFGYHRLARTAHVDTSIATLGRTYAEDRQDWGLTDDPDPDAPPDGVLAAWRSGYLSGFDRDRLIRVAAEVGGRMRLRVADGGFMVEGDPLVEFWGDDGRMRAAFRCTAEIAAYRSDRPTGPFSLALLTEIGTRALSPAVNDPLTAAACADWIGHGLSARLGEEDAPMGWFTDAAGAARLMVPESGVVVQSRPYLAMFQRAVRDSPLVSARLVSAYAAALRRARDPSDRMMLRGMIDEVIAAAPDDMTAGEREMLLAARPGADEAAPDRPLACSA